MDFKEEIVKLLQTAVNIQIEKDLIEIPPDSKLGDYAVPCFRFAKQLRKAPNIISADLAQKIKPNEFFSQIISNGPYLNFFASKGIMNQEILQKIITEKLNYGMSQKGKGKNVVIDFSSPNIAKPFGIAHIRSTVIGNSLGKIFSAMGYKVIGINHLGDWGTQFGKLMVAYLKWGDSKRLKNEGIDYLVEIYIEFGNKAKEDSSLDEEARKWFKKLEDKDPEATKLWKQFRDLSLEEFDKYYKQLEIKFDYIQGEAFYNDKLESTIEYVKSKVATEESEGALIVRLEDKGIDTPLILRKSDEASTYHTRDLAAAFYRLKTYNPAKILYVVGAQQILHFRQLFATLGKAGEDANIFVHVPFGSMSFEGATMSTRKGNFVLLRDVLQEAIDKVQSVIAEKNPNLKNKKEIAQQVGIGAVIFGDLSNDRIRDVEFKWEKALNFEGETAPYLQYTHARICSIERKAQTEHQYMIPTSLKGIKVELLTEGNEFELIKVLGQFPAEIENSANAYKPNLIANYIVTVGQTFNKFYTKCPVLKEQEDLRNARLLLIECTRIVLEKGLSLLGIHAPNEM